MSQDTNTRFYRHYKNKPYKFLGIVRHSETLEEMALYETLYENELGRLWVRPKDMFFENIEIGGQLKARFEKVRFDFKHQQNLSDLEIQQIGEIYENSFNSAFNKENFKNKVNAHTDFLYVLAYEKDKLIGFKIGYAEDKNTFYSWLGGVLPDYRKLGISSQMMSLQQNWCQEQGFKKIQTRSRNDFPEMIKLNLKFGYRIIGTQVSHGDEIKILFEKEI